MHQHIPGYRLNFIVQRTVSNRPQADVQTDKARVVNQVHVIIQRPRWGKIVYAVNPAATETVRTCRLHGEGRIRT
jgi:hypothetical protein